MEIGNLTRQPGGSLGWGPHPEGMWQVWERPLVGCRYLLSVRGGGAWKLVGGQRDRERSVVMVLRKGYLEEGTEKWVPTRLVARLRAPWEMWYPIGRKESTVDPTPLAERTALLAEWYGDALTFVEVKDGAIVAKECQRLGVPVQVREVLDKATGQWTQDIGWLTDEESGAAALNALVNAIRESRSAGSRLGLRMECEHCRGELETFVAADSTTPAVRHDDDVRTLATALFNLDSATKLHADTRARLAPQDGWRVMEG